MPAPHTWTVTIDASPENVWPWVGNLEKHADWSPRPYRVEWVSGEPNAVGSTFRSFGRVPNDKDHAMEGRVSVSEPLKVFEVTTHDDKQQWTNRFELAPSGAGTTVTKTMEGPESFLLKAMYEVALVLFVRRAVQKGLDMLKARAEGSS
jgi:uncharacterized protein YndB with AHSA1/START domain